MNTTLPPATTRARAIRAKLAALVERGVNGERTAAAAKLARLEKRFDFNAPDTTTADLFAGIFRVSSEARPVAVIPEPDIANAVKWSFETAAGIPCLFVGSELRAQADPGTCTRMRKIAGTVADSFRELWTRYAAAGADGADRGHFILGLYEGMMREERTSERLPTRTATARLAKAKRRAVAHAPGLALHPYTVAVGLGRNIRFDIPLSDLAAQLEQTIKGEIAA